MKHMRKVFALALTLIMALALTVPAFAVEATNGTNNSSDPAYQTGTITVSNPTIGETYTIYCLLDLESYNNTNKAFSYKVNSAWSAFFAQEAISGVDGYVTIDGQGYVTWKEGASAADFAALAIAYAKANSIASVRSVTPSTDAPTVQFTGLGLGYYLIDSSMGTLCALDTTNNEVTVFEKNGVPTSTKTVKEDSTGIYGASNDADICDTIEYKATITVPGGKTTGAADDSSVDTAIPGAQNYVLHDTMDAGLVFDASSVIVTLTHGATISTVAASNYTVAAGNNVTDGCTFEVRFAQTFCDTLQKDDVITVTYTATFDDDATIVAGQDYENDAWLTYGEEGGPQTTVSTTSTKTFDVTVFKYAMVDNEETALEGAIFNLYKMVPATDADGKVIADKTVKSYAIAEKAADANVYTITGWVTEAYDQVTGDVAADVAIPDDATEMTSPADGTFTIHGLDSDTYKLLEIEAPDGYNKLAEASTITVNGANVAMYKVLNQSGAELPSTGGIGTTIFYMVGGILMAGAAILLITKKKMSNEQ